MLLRVRGPEGVTRVEVVAAEAKAVYAAVASSVKKDVGEIIVTSDQAGSVPLPVSGMLPLKHGDMIFVKFKAASAPAETTPLPLEKQSVLLVKHEPVDEFLEKQKGLIMRSRDPNFCRHSGSGMCDYCMPLEPYDANYLEKNKIKHMSYHAYLRQVTSAAKTPAFTSPNFIPPLDEPSLKVINPCPSKSHGPYPEGICTKCQPSAITLQTQNFRMVDHVEFESPKIIEDFLSFWRQSGSQRFGLMYGRYEPYSEVPLGVKAVVSAIYEPPQSSASDMIQLTLPDPEEANVRFTVNSLDLQLVGMIYTDLFDDGKGQATVICKRHGHSYFVSSAEMLFSAEMQHTFPVPCRYSATHKFGSRFVTCIISGNQDSQIDILCVQISNAGVAMARDGIIEASVEPSLMRVRASSNEQYIPEVFYKYRNKYGLMIQEAAKPTFPVEYLLVTLSHGFPQEPKPLFKAPVAFPIENRGGLASQSMGAIKKHLESNGAKLIDLISEFHFLLYLKSSNIVEEDDLKLAAAVAKSGRDLDLSKLVTSGGWQTLLMIANEAAADQFGGMGGGSSGSRGGAPWNCRHCTYVNISGDSCDVCGLPKD